MQFLLNLQRLVHYWACVWNPTANELLWDVMPCRLVEFREELSICCWLGLFFDPEDGSTTSLRGVAELSKLLFSGIWRGIVRHITDVSKDCTSVNRWFFCFPIVCCLANFSALKIRPVVSSEISLTFYRTRRGHIPEYSTLHSQGRICVSSVRFNIRVLTSAWCGCERFLHEAKWSYKVKTFAVVSDTAVGQNFLQEVVDAVHVLVCTNNVCS
jgi:hypothetical protein